MDVQKILGMTDHTLLRVGCTKSEIAQICEDAVTYRCASVCIPPCFVSDAKECIGGRGGVKVCTVIGFPNGYNTAKAKACEAKGAVANGADEIDMVINMSLVKDRNWKKIALCQIVTQCKADFIKTSTGFSTGGATAADVALLRAHVGPNVGVKASGGIHSLEEAQAMIDAGASRIGASSVVKAAKEVCG